MIRMIEYYQDVQEESEELSKEIGKLPLYEFSLDLVKSYQEGTLKKEVKNCIINK